MLSLPDRFVAFTEQSLDSGYGMLLDCVRVQYNYQNIYRLLPVTQDEHRQEYPNQISGQVSVSVPDESRYFRPEESTLLVQVSGSANQRTNAVTEVDFYITPFRVLIEDRDYTYDEYDRHLWRNRRGQNERYFRLVILLSRSNRILYTRGQTPTLVNLEINQAIFQDLDTTLQEILNYRRDRPSSRNTDDMYNPTRHHMHTDIHEFFHYPRRRPGIIPPPLPPQTPRRQRERRVIRGAGAGDEDVGPAGGEPHPHPHPHPQQREVRVILQRPSISLPSERVCVALARDYVVQGETCPILQEPLAWGPIAVTACHCVFSGDSLAVWAANNTTCPSCRQALEYRVVRVTKPLENDGQPLQIQDTPQVAEQQQQQSEA
jgi:hypothetical protein